MAARGERILSTGQHEARDFDSDQPSEWSPLLSPQDAERSRRASASLPRRAKGSENGQWRWPSLAALLLLCLLALLIMVFAFVTPSLAQTYAQQAVVFEPISLSMDSFLEDGVRARVQGLFRLDASRVQRKTVRDFGRFCTYLATEIETGNTELEASLPEYGNALLGTARVPPIKVYIRNGHTTSVDILVDLQPGDVDGIRRIAHDWADGRLGQLRVVGKAFVPIKSGLFDLGTHIVQHEMLFTGNDIPTLPAYKIKKLNFREVEIPTGKGMTADVSLQIQNDFPVELAIPPLGFGILVDNCERTDDLIMVADAFTQHLYIRPNQAVEVNVTGTVRQFPPMLVQDCPGTGKSPLDNLLGRYVHGEKNIVYVHGSDSPSLQTPRWMIDLISNIVVPVPIPGRTFGHLIKNFTLADTHFSFPDPMAEPDAPKSNPRISATVRALVALPEEINFDISVGKVRADADVLYKGKKLGRLDLSKWQEANSTRVNATADEGPGLLVESRVKDAPLYIDDEDLFANVIQELIFSSKTVVMQIKALVDVGIETVVGEFTVRRIPADGQVPIQPISRPRAPPHDSPSPGNPAHQLPPGLGNLTGRVHPRLVDLRVLDTTETSLTIGSKINLTNPTAYSASIPYIDVQILKNGSILGHATGHDLAISPGTNGNLEFSAVYDPFTIGGGEKARLVGRELLSQYLSGWNTTITFRLHEGSFPSHPKLGRVLSRFPVTITAPHVSSPSHGDDDDDDDGDGDDQDGNDQAMPAHFLSNTTFHLFSSTATFLLKSPLRHHSTLYIERINATAFYKTSPAGIILYNLPFGVPPISETLHHEGFQTPRLPVDWSFGGVGYEAIRKAVGGHLRLSAQATVDVRLGRWSEQVWFHTHGLGARIRF